MCVCCGGPARDSRPARGPNATGARWPRVDAEGSVQAVAPTPKGGLSRGGEAALGLMVSLCLAGTCCGALQWANLPGFVLLFLGGLFAAFGWGLGGLGLVGIARVIS